MHKRSFWLEFLGIFWLGIFGLGMLWPIGALATPSIVLKGVTGQEHNVNEFIGHGKWTVVTFWAHDCPICKRDIDQMVFLHDEHRKKDATVLGISIDGYANRRAALDFINDQALNFPNLITDHAGVAQFGGGELVGTPTYYVYNPQGELKATKIGAATQDQIEALMVDAPQPPFRKNTAVSSMSQKLR